MHRDLRPGNILCDEVACRIPRADWTRGFRPEVTLLIQSQAVASSIWADAVQLEEGARATPYTVGP